MDMLSGRKVLNRGGGTYPIARALHNKRYVVYLFTASYVTAPRLMDLLKETYHENLRRNVGLEVIYVNADVEERQFKTDYTSRHGPWLAVPFKDPLATELRYEVTSMPTIVVVTVDGAVITTRGREELESKGVNVLVSWTEYES